MDTNNKSYGFTAADLTLAALAYPFIQPYEMRHWLVEPSKLPLVVKELCDELFATNTKRVFEFCRKIKPLRIPWQCQLRVPGVDDDLLKTMKNSGCYLVSYGFESASNTVLKSMKKGITVKQIEKVIPLTSKNKLNMQANFIFGDPGETLETAEETLNFARRFKSHYISLLFVKPYPGSQLYHDLIKKNAIKNLWHFWIHSTYDEGSRMINMTSLPDIEFTLLKARVFLENMQQNYYTIKDMKIISENIFVLAINCPICKKTSEELILEKPGLVACPNCFMRSWIDPIDLSGNNNFKKQTRKYLRKLSILIGKILLNRNSTGLLICRCLSLIPIFRTHLGKRLLGAG